MMNHGQGRWWGRICVASVVALLILQEPSLNFIKFTLSDYRQMVNDKSRTQSYYDVIDYAAPGRIVMDLGTGAFALFAIRCAEAGATHVYAIESNAKAAERARQTVEMSGWARRITIIEGRSQDIKLPRKVDLVVHELIGELASGEGLANVLRHAVQHHIDPIALAQGDWSVPKYIATWMTPVRLPLASVYANDPKSFRDLNNAMKKRSRRPVVVPDYPVGSTCLGRSQTIEEFALFPEQGEDTSSWPPASWSRQDNKLRFPILRAGNLAGLLLHVTVDCGSVEDDDGVTSAAVTSAAVTLDSADKDSHWACSLLVAQNPQPVDLCDELLVRTSIDLESENPTYNLRGVLLRAADGRQVELVNSSFDALSFLPPSVRPGAPKKKLPYWRRQRDAPKKRKKREGTTSYLTGSERPTSLAVPYN